MPLATIASAASLISCSLTLQPKWFQLFHPIGGVRASPLSRAARAPRPGPGATTGAMSSTASNGLARRECTEAFSLVSRALVLERVVIHVQHGEPREMRGEPCQEVRVALSLARRPQHLRERARPRERHVLRPFRVGDVFG